MGWSVVGPLDILNAVRELEDYYVVELGVDPMALTSFRADLLTLMMSGGLNLSGLLEATDSVFAGREDEVAFHEDDDGGLTISLPTKEATSRN
jgi:hypothetical protein